MVPTARTAGIILAAGMSKRFGKPKQLMKIGQEFIINRVVNSALESCLDTVVLVLGHHHYDILPIIGNRSTPPKLSVLMNSDYRSGMSSSLKCGVKAVDSHCDAVMFLLGDQPLLDSITINLLLAQFRLSDKGICVPFYQGKRRNPAMFSRRYYSSLLAIQGDTGARAIIDKHPKDVLCVEINRPELFLDVDTPADLKVVESLGKKF